ncbi:MAG: hypothetical protein COC12_01115 [Rhodobacteraceae bacterium]|nr:MAG: hypothetical protein COC12_01115 [Paracoccaceae bacterium]
MAETNKPDTETDADPVIEADATETEAASDPEDQPAETPPIEVKKSGGFAPALIGGFVAAALGFFAARTDVLDFILPGSTKVTQALDDLRGTDTKQASDLVALRAELAAIDLPDLAPLNTQLAAIQTELARLNDASEAQQSAISDLESRLAPLSSRLETLEKRPMTDGASDAAIAAYDRELAAMQQTIAEQRAEVAAMIDNARATEDAARALERNAASTALKAQNQATIARLFGTLENGTPYASILAELTVAGITIPPALKASANDGVPTLAALSDAFPAAARAALSATRAEGTDGGGLGGFLQRQLGARSVAPREGDDTDAILSRAEAAVTAGDLPNALSEIAALPETAQTQMQAWVDTATTRLTALQAANELAQSLNTN